MSLWVVLSLCLRAPGSAPHRARLAPLSRLLLLSLWCHTPHTCLARFVSPTTAHHCQTLHPVPAASGTILMSSAPVKHLCSSWSVSVDRLFSSYGPFFLLLSICDSLQLDVRHWMLARWVQGGLYVCKSWAFFRDAVRFLGRSLVLSDPVFVISRPSWSRFLCR